MRERFRDTPIELEDRADAALKSGAFADADAYLTELLRTQPHPDKLHHALLKQAAMPLYELAYGTNPSDAQDVYDEANDVYGLVGKLIQHELYTFSHTYHKEVGRISELTFFALRQRTLFSEATDTVTLPSPATDDKRGIDFYRSPVGTRKITDGHSYQIKTRATPEDRARYEHSKTILISMSDIDRYAADPLQPKSLPRTILRELGIPLLDTDEANLDQCSPGADSSRLDRANVQIDKRAGHIQDDSKGALARTTLQAAGIKAA